MKGAHIGSVTWVSSHGVLNCECVANCSMGPITVSNSNAITARACISPSPLDINLTLAAASSINCKSFQNFPKNALPVNNRQCEIRRLVQ